MPFYYLLISLFAFVAAPMMAQAEPLTVASYNIKHGQGRDGRVDLERQARLIAQLNADVVALQEVDFKTKRSRFVHQAKEMARLLRKTTGDDWRHLDAPAIRFGGGAYGNAILFNEDRMDVLDYEVQRLPGHPDGDRFRSAGVAQFKTNNGRRFTFIGTHLTHRNVTLGQDKTLQERSVALLNQSAPSGEASFIVGDLNATMRPGYEVNSKTIALLNASNWRSRLPNTDDCTSQKNLVDHIFVRNITLPTSGEARIVCDLDAHAFSDHYPISMTVVLE